MDVHAVRERLRAEAAAVGGIVHWAAQRKVPASVISDILNGRREPTPQVLRAMGLTLVRDYQLLERNSL